MNLLWNHIFLITLLNIFSYETKKHIEKLLKLHQRKANGINILNLYLPSSDNQEQITIKNEELSFKLFEHSSSNMPILYSINNYTTNVLKRLVT